jgi:hypothetical protein
MHAGRRRTRAGPTRKMPWLEPCSVLCCMFVNGAIHVHHAFFRHSHPDPIPAICIGLCIGLSMLLVESPWLSITHMVLSRMV